MGEDIFRAYRSANASRTYSSRQQQNVRISQWTGRRDIHRRYSDFAGRFSRPTTPVRRGSGGNAYYLYRRPPPVSPASPLPLLCGGHLGSLTHTTLPPTALAAQLSKLLSGTTLPFPLSPYLHRQLQRKTPWLIAAILLRVGGRPRYGSAFATLAGRTPASVLRHWTIR